MQIKEKKKEEKIKEQHHHPRKLGEKKDFKAAITIEISQTINKKLTKRY